MSLGLAAQDCDLSFHRLIQAIANREREESRAAWRAWQVARAQLADHQAKATESGQTQTAHAIVEFLRVSQAALDGNGQGLLAGYPHYLAARNELFKIVGGDGMMYLLARNSAPVLNNAALAGLSGECDFKAALDGIQRQGENPLARRRVAAL